MSTISAENISQSDTELTEQGTFPRFLLLRAELSQACSPGSEHFELPARRGQLPVSAGRRNPQLGTTRIYVTPSFRHHSTSAQANKRHPGAGKRDKPCFSAEPPAACVGAPQYPHDSAPAVTNWHNPGKARIHTQKEARRTCGST